MLLLLLYCGIRQRHNSIESRTDLLYKRSETFKNEPRLKTWKKSRKIDNFGNTSLRKPWQCHNSIELRTFSNSNDPKSSKMNLFSKSFFFLKKIMKNRQLNILHLEKPGSVTTPYNFVPLIIQTIRNFQKWISSQNLKKTMKNRQLWKYFT